MVNFKLLERFPVDHLPHPVVIRLILSFCQFTAFANGEICKSAILLRLIYSCLDIVLIALFCVAIRRYSVFLFRFSFLSHVQVFSCGISLMYHLKRPYFCFSSHFLWLILFFWFIYCLSCFWSLSFSALFYVVFFLYRRIDVILKSGESSYFFSWHIQSVNVISGM